MKSIAGNSSSPSVPQLLVSVRNASEAQAALAGGCEILDVKEPLRGPLGMADPAEIAEVLKAAREFDPRIPVSVALGDARDWQGQGGGGTEFPQFPIGLDYLKLGTAGFAAVDDWAALWRETRERWDRQTLGQPDSTTAPAWIVVAYADYQHADSPTPAAVIREARGLGCCGVLIDTWSKQQPGLLHWLAEGELVELSRQAKAADLSFALAGRLQPANLPELLRVEADVLGVRGAVCRNRDRSSVLDAAAVADFKRQMVSAAGFSPRPQSLPPRQALPAC